MDVHALDFFQQVVQHVVVGLYPDPSGFYYLLNESLLAFAGSRAAYMSVSASRASQLR